MLLKGELIRLTAIRREDLPKYRAWNGEEAFGRYYNASPIREISEKKADEWFEEDSDKDYRFAIRPVDGEEFYGVCAIEDIMWTHRVGWISIALGPNYQGKGFGKEAMRLLMAYGFNELNLHRIQLTVFDYNKPAIQMYESLGFKREGTFREFMQRDGVRYDMHLYGLLTGESQ